MDARALKPSRVRRMREIDNLVREAKEICSDFEEHRRQRIRLARKARQLVNKAKRKYPDMHLVDDPLTPGLHDQLEDLAKTLYVTNNPSQKEDPINQIGFSFDRLFSLLKRLTDVPWLDPLG